MVNLEIEQSTLGDTWYNIALFFRDIIKENKIFCCIDERRLTARIFNVMLKERWQWRRNIEVIVIILVREKRKLKLIR